MAWGKNGTPITLGSSADDMDITDLGGKTFNQFLIHEITSGTAQIETTFNNDTGSNYAKRNSAGGAADSTSTSQSNLRLDLTGALDAFIMCNFLSISSEEKLGIIFSMTPNTAGAGNAPERFEIVAKWADTSNTMDRIDCNNSAGGSYDTNSNLSALGTD